MLYCISDASFPMSYVSSGNLVSEGGFVHPRRILDTFVFILVQQGTLHITQGQKNYSVHSNEFIILFPDRLHYGYRPCEGKLSYYWVHFIVTDPHYCIYNQGALLRHEEIFSANPTALNTPKTPEHYLLPEYGTSSLSQRLTLLFVQLLDISKRQDYRMTWNSHYALSLLLMELSTEVLITQQIEKNDIPMQILTIIEWIRIHYEQPLTVAGIAERFNYHPTYLTGLFKKYTGYPLMTYINRVRITISKNLLTDQAYKVSTIARLCGFTDEKYFMKLFKRYEGMTPSQYRNTFHQKKMNLI